MSPRKFRVGETIRFTSPFHGRYSASGTYTIVGYRPQDGDEPTYVIKSDSENYQRIAGESELRHGQPDQ